jgi:hypothetical protein
VGITAKPAPAGVSMETRQSYAWQWCYEVALVSTDRTHLPALITTAQAAIDARIAEIKTMNDGTADERQAITDARNGLQILIAEVRT